jgi:TonB family protein
MCGFVLISAVLHALSAFALWVATVRINAGPWQGNAVPGATRFETVEMAVYPRAPRAADARSLGRDPATGAEFPTFASRTVATRRSRSADAKWPPSKPSGPLPPTTPTVTPDQRHAPDATPSSRALAEYWVELHRRLQRAGRQGLLPRGASGTQTIRVRITIDAEGSITSARVVDADTGTSALAAQALAAVRLAGPLAPPPIAPPTGTWAVVVPYRFDVDYLGDSSGRRLNSR